MGGELLHASLPDCRTVLSLTTQLTTFVGFAAVSREV